MNEDYIEEANAYDKTEVLHKHGKGKSYSIKREANKKRLAIDAKLRALGDERV